MGGPVAFDRLARPWPGREGARPEDGRGYSGTPVSRARALRAVSWSTVGTVGSALLAFARAGVLARLLRPEDFGLFGLALFAVIAVNQFTDLGLGTSALVERFGSADERARFLDTIWTTQLGRALGLVLLLLVTAAAYGNVMGDPRLGPILVALAAWLVLTAATNPGLLLMQRELDQRPLAQLRLGTEGLGLLLTVGAAWLWPSPWALVFGFLVSAALGCAGSYFVSAWRPQLGFDGRLFRRGIRLGKHAAVVVALAFVTTQVDNVIVGRLLGAAVLGIYLFAYRVASLPIDVMQSAFSGVMVPAYAGLRDQGPQVVAKHFARVLSIATTILCLLLLPALLLRREMVMIIGGVHWLAAIPLIPPLLLLALLRGTMIQLGTLLYGMGRVDLDARCKIAEAAFFVPACVAGVHMFGVAGAAWAGAASYALGVIVRSLAVSHVLSLPVHQVIGPWLRVVVVALGCVVAGNWLETEGTPSVLVAPAMVVALAGAMLGLDAVLRYEIRQLGVRLG